MTDKMTEKTNDKNHETAIDRDARERAFRLEAQLSYTESALHAQARALFGMAGSRLSGDDGDVVFGIAQALEDRADAIDRVLQDD